MHGRGRVFGRVGTRFDAAERFQRLQQRLVRVTGRRGRFSSPAEFTIAKRTLAGIAALFRIAVA